MRSVLIICASILLSHLAIAQSATLCDSGSTTRGTVKVYADPKLNQAIAPEEVPDDEQPQMPGYRIQIYLGTDRNQANKVKAEFLQMYPDQPAYLDYQAPNFRIRVGDFRDKLEAQKLFHELKDVFDGVLIVPDKINFPQLKP